jgi:hypothetical protein
MARFTVFYGTQIYGEYGSWNSMYTAISSNDDVYQGGYFYTADIKDKRWFRMDGTPVLLEDVPKVQRMLALVLNL